MALDHIHSKKYCYADFKPSNVLLGIGQVGSAVLADFGATVLLGQPIIEFSQAYCLDVDVQIASELIDWTCFATSLAQIARIDIFTYPTVSELLQVVVASSMDELLKTVIISCLKNPNSKNIQSAVDAFTLKYLNNSPK